MAYQFSNQKKASATIYRVSDPTAKFKLNGINGQQVSADNFHTAITGLLTVAGLQSGGMERAITQEVEESP